MSTELTHSDLFICIHVLVQILVKIDSLAFSCTGSGDLSFATIILMRNHPRVICYRHLWKGCKLKNKLKTSWEVKIAEVITVIHLL